MIYKEREQWLSGSGWVLLLAAIALSGLGILGIYVGEVNSESGPVTTLRQTGYLAAGMIAFIVVLFVGHQRLAEWSYPLYAVVLVLLVMLLVAKKVPLEPLIRPRRNAYRWIDLGPINMQVSEVAKIVCVLATAWYLRFKRNQRSLLGLALPAVLALVPTLLVLVEPDLGTSLLFLPVFFAMVFAAGAKLKHLAMLIGAGLIIAPAFYNSPFMSAYQKQRIEVLLRQNEDNQAWQMSAGYQLRQSKIAIGSGGIVGSGLQPAAFFRHKLLPEDHNDFIFAVLAHQWGFLGCVAILGLYLLAVGTCLVIASSTHDPVGRLVAVGVAAMIFGQTIVNIGMTTGWMPITGMTLPFVSFGGSSLIANYIALGLVCSVARRRPRSLAPRPFEQIDYEWAM